MQLLGVARVEVEASPGVWQDLTPSTIKVSVNRADGDIGVCSVLIRDEALDPTSSPLLRSGAPLRVLAKNGAGWSPIFTGAVDTCPVEYEPLNRAGKRTFITINAHDNVARLSELTESRGVGTITALRWLLKDSGVPFVVNGNVTSLPTGTVVSTNENSNMWAQVLVTRDSALGYVHVDVLNRVCAWDNTARSTTPTVTLRPTNYTSLDTDFNPDDVINSVTVNWLRYDVGSDATTEVPYGPYEDAASIAQFGRRSATFTIGGPVESASVIASYANGVLTRNATATTKARSAVVVLDSEADLAFARDLDLNSPVRVFLHDGTTSQDLRVVGIAQDLEGSRWKLTLTFGPLLAVSRPAVPPGTGIPLIPDNFVPSGAFVSVDATKITGILSPDRLDETTLAGQTMTGGLVQTESTPARGIKLDTAALVAYDSAGTPTLAVDAESGSVSMKGNLTSGSQVYGAEIKGSTFVVGDENGFHTRHSAAIINGGPRATIRFHNGLKAYADIFAQDDDDQNEALKIQAGDGTFFSPKLWMRGANSYLELKGDVRAMPGGGRSFFIDARPTETTIHAKAFEVNGDGRVWARNLDTLTGGTVLRIGTAGQVFKDGSASRFKVNVEPIEPPRLRALLNVPVKSWYDLPNAERYADHLTTGDTDLAAVEPLRRVPGVIAEDVEAAGLTEFVQYDETGAVEGVAYDRLGVALIPLVKELMDRVELLEQRLAAIEGTQP